MLKKTLEKLNDGRCSSCLVIYVSSKVTGQYEKKKRFVHYFVLSLVKSPLFQTEPVVGTRKKPLSPEQKILIADSVNPPAAFFRFRCSSVLPI